jgi:ELWxxDGT repeat protein
LADGDGSAEIWSTDGTPAGTVRAITAASGMLDPRAFTVVDGRLYFAARRLDDASGRVLPWVSDGTDAGTVLLADVELGADSTVPLDRPPFVALGDRVFFAASDLAHGEELWSTDGTSAGTSLVRDIAPGFLGSYPRNLTVWRGRLYFRARDRLHGMELWSSDGSGQGTRLVQDIAAGASWSAPGELTPTEQGLYFSAHDGVHGRELWVLPESP